MSKKPGAVAIIIAVLVSIILFPLIVATGLASGAVFSAATIIEPGRENEIFDKFMAEGGLDTFYEELITETGASFEGMEGVDIDAKELLPKADVEKIVGEMFRALMSEQQYNADLSAQKNYLEGKLDEYFEANIDAAIEEKGGEYYDLMTEDQKKEVENTVRNEYETYKEKEILSLVEELETEVSGIVNSLYDTPEYEELKELERQTGYSFFERTKLNADLNLAGYILLGICAFFMVLLLLGHLFRPAGFFTVGVYSLLTGGLMKAAAILIPGAFDTTVRAELETVIAAELPKGMEGSILAVLEDVLQWGLSGFDKVGTIGLWCGLILALVGILLLVLRKKA